MDHDFDFVGRMAFFHIPMWVLTSHKISICSTREEEAADRVYHCCKKKGEREAMEINMCAVKVV